MTRTIVITMSDDMRFSPDQIDVWLGETVRFVPKNVRKMLHEMVIGTASALQDHAQLMLQFPEMEHDAAWIAHVPQGQTGEIVWHFNRPGQFSFACLLPGHFQAGMVGSIRVNTR